jgi:FG-GAP-like repeat
VKVVDYALVRPQLPVALADWDSDGRLDVVAALSIAVPGLYRSVGAWSPAAEVTAARPVEGSPIDFYLQPCVVDWDRDGRLDLVIAQPSGIAWYRNIAEAGEPLLERSRVLLPSLPRAERLEGLSTADWDLDGWPDLIVGYIRCTYDEKGAYCSATAGVRVYPRKIQSTRSTGK